MTTTQTPDAPATDSTVPADGLTAAATPPPTAAPAPAATPSTTLSVLSLVLSIVGIATGQGLIGIAGIVLGFLSRSREPHAQLTANWGIGLGFFAVFGWIVFAIIGVAAFAPLWFFGLAG